MNSAQKQSGENKEKLKGSPLRRNRLWFTARGYALSLTASRLRRNWLATLMTLTVIGISLSLPALFVFLATDLQKLSDSGLKAPGITTYLSNKVDKLGGAALAEQLKLRPDIKSASYISSEEALQVLRENTDLDAAIDTLGRNPLPASIIIQPSAGTRSTASHRLMAEQLQAMPEIDTVQLDLEWVERVHSFATLLNTGSALFGLVLVIASLMVIANTIRLELLRHARESQVVTLLGGKSAFISRPFIYLGAIYGVLGSLVGIGLALVLISVLNKLVQDLASSYASDFHLSWPGPEMIASLVFGAMILGILASIITLFSQRSISHQNS